MKLRANTFMMFGSGIACFMSLALAVNLFTQGSLNQASSAQKQAAKAVADAEQTQALSDEDESARGRFEQGCIFPAARLTGKPLALTNDIGWQNFPDGSILCDRLGTTAVVQAGKLTAKATIQNWNAYREEKRARVQRNLSEGKPVPQNEATLRSN